MARFTQEVIELHYLRMHQMTLCIGVPAKCGTIYGHYYAVAKSCKTYIHISMGIVDCIPSRVLTLSGIHRHLSYHN